MKSRSKTRSLAGNHFCGLCAILFLILQIGSAWGARAQETAQAPKAVKTADRLDVPYWGDKSAMEKLAKAPFGFITDISTRQDGGSLIVSVKASCKPFFEEFRLTDPPRLVVDFLNMENRTPAYSYVVGNAGIRQLRMAQFQGADPVIARLVFDLNSGFSNYDIVTDDQGMRISFGPSQVPAESSDSPATVPASKPAVVEPIPPAANAAGKTAAAEKSARPALPPVTALPAVPEAARKAATAEPPKTPSLPPAAPAQEKTSAPPVTAEKAKDAPPVVAPREIPKVTPPVPSAKVAVDEKAAPPSRKVDLPAAPPDARPETPATLVRPALPGNPPAAGLATATSEPAVKADQPAGKTGAPAASAAPSAPSSQDGYSGHPLTLDLVNFSLVDFFRLMAEEGGINIVVDPDVRGTASIKMTKAPWDQIFDVVLRNNGLEKQVDGNVVRIATKKTIQAEAKQIADLKKEQLLAADIETRVRRLNYAQTKTLIAVLKDQMSVRGTIVEDERSGSLVLTDVPAALDKVMDLIDMLDMPEPQVEIEARIVSATRDFARDIGVQFGFVQGNLQRTTVGGPNTFSSIGGYRPSSTPTNTYSAGNPITGRGSSQSSSTESGGVSAGSSATGNAGNYNVNLPSLTPFGGIGLSVGNILDTFLLDAAITAGESKGQAKLISQPKLTTQNNNPGVITQGLRFPVQVVANNTVTVQFQNAALTLTVTPQITADGNIVLDLKIENNTPDFTKQVLGIPSVRTSESSTRVLVKDGGTTVIGGIILDNETTQEDRVPGLASLPLLGNLFKRTAVSHNSQEILFFITPKVVK